MTIIAPPMLTILKFIAITAALFDLHFRWLEAQLKTKEIDNGR